MRIPLPRRRSWTPSSSSSCRRNQLSYTTYILNNRGQVQLIPKEEIKKVTGSSPDHSDSLVLAYRAKKLCSGEVKGHTDAASIAARLMAAHR